MPEISVIVPVYNIEQYLRQCLDSILCQTFSDFELILVDDGSKDSSGQICDDYSEKDERIIVIHQINAGVSAARNKGLEIATGKSIVFIDADDLINADYLERLNSEEYDFVLSNFDDYWPDTQKIIRYPANGGEFDISDEEDILAYLKDGYAPGFVWGKRFSRAVIENNKIRFDENQKHSEDILFVGEFIKHINKLYKLDYTGYHHCQYESGTLSNVAMNQLLIARMDWWEKALSQFEGYPKVQKYYAEMFLFLFEKEITRIESFNQTFIKKRNLIKAMLQYDSLKRCIEISPHVLPRTVCFFAYHKMSLAILIKYKI